MEKSHASCLSLCWPGLLSNGRACNHITNMSMRSMPCASLKMCKAMTSTCPLFQWALAASTPSKYSYYRAWLHGSESHHPMPRKLAHRLHNTPEGCMHPCTGRSATTFTHHPPALPCAFKRAGSAP